MYGMLQLLIDAIQIRNDPKQVTQEAYKRHMAFYNCTPRSPVSMWTAASMEKLHLDHSGD